VFIGVSVGLLLQVGTFSTISCAGGQPGGARDSRSEKFILDHQIGIIPLARLGNVGFLAIQEPALALPLGCLDLLLVAVYKEPLHGGNGLVL
jgi:hypothetical protein